jgi:SNF2 family DNA or RNA helicase
MLVIAPLRVCYNVWPAEIEKWQDFRHLKYRVLHGKGKTDEALEDESIDVYITNPDSIEWLFTKQRFRLLDADMLVIDESSKFKNTQTKRFKLLRPYLPKFRRRLILTGSPAARNLMDLFGQMYIIDLGRALGQYITHYRMKYFDPTGFGGFTWALKKDDKGSTKATEQAIYKAVKPYVLRLEAEDYIHMPKLVEQDIWVDMPPKEYLRYTEMEDDLVAILESGTGIEAPTAAAARTKCAQMANGAVYTQPLEVMQRRGKLDFEELHDAKLDALEEYLAERNGQPTLVLFQFKHDLIRIRKRLGAGVPCLSDASLAQGRVMENSWNAGDLPVLLGQPQSIGHGLNLQGSNAQHLLWFSLPDDFDVYDQTNRRLRRSGNTNAHVFAARILAKGTVDVAKRAMLSVKDKRQKAFLDAMKTYRARRTK